jgi:hypothetical protein
VEEKPGAGRIRPIPADDSDGVPGNFPDFFVDGEKVGVGHRTGAAARIEARLPENFIRHPVADAGKKILQEKECLERRLPAPLKDRGQAWGGEFPG